MAFHDLKIAILSDSRYHCNLYLSPIYHYSSSSAQINIYYISFIRITHIACTEKSYNHVATLKRFQRTTGTYSVQQTVAKLYYSELCTKRISRNFGMVKFGLYRFRRVTVKNTGTDPHVRAHAYIYLLYAHSHDLRILR